jgi:hypothetical protein
MADSSSEVEKTITLSVDDRQVIEAQKQLELMQKLFESLQNASINFEASAKSLSVIADKPKSESKSSKTAAKKEYEDSGYWSKKAIDERALIDARANAQRLKREEIVQKELERKEKALIKSRELLGTSGIGRSAAPILLAGAVWSLANGFAASVQGSQDLANSISLASAKYNTSVETIGKYRNALGLSADDAGTLNERMIRFGKTDQDIIQVSKEMEGAQNSFQRLAIAGRVVGYDFAEKIAPALMTGSKNVQRSFDDIRSFGGGFDANAIASFKLIQISMDRLKMSSEGLTGEIAVGLAPIITYLSTNIARGTHTVTVFMKQLSESRVLLVGAGVAAIGLGAALTAGLFPAFVETMAVFGPWAIGLGLIYILLEDLVAWAQGDASMFGVMLDKLFGKGSSEAVRKWWEGLLGSMNDTIPTLKYAWEIIKQLTQGLWELGKIGTELLVTGVESLTADPTDTIGAEVRKQRVQKLNQKAYDLVAPDNSNRDDLAFRTTEMNLTSSPKTIPFDRGSLLGQQPSNITVQAPPAQIVQKGDTIIQTNVSEQKIRQIIREEKGTSNREKAANTFGMVPQMGGF